MMEIEGLLQIMNSSCSTLSICQLQLREPQKGQSFAVCDMNKDLYLVADFMLNIQLR